MNCREAAPEIIETARAGSGLAGALKRHLESCGACAERWELEREVSSHLQLLRAAPAGARSSRASRNDLMRQFSARHWRLVHPAWGIGLAAAAGLVIVFATVRGPLQPVSTKEPAPPAMGAWFSAISSTFEPSPDQYYPDTSQAEGYVAVPYAPPLAPGERLSVMQAELYPAALTSLGVNVDPVMLASNGSATIHADVVVGEDGLPRAVRLDRSDGTDSTNY